MNHLGAPSIWKDFVAKSFAKICRLVVGVTNCSAFRVLLFIKTNGCIFINSMVLFLEKVNFIIENEIENVKRENCDFLSLVLLNIK